MAAATLYAVNQPTAEPPAIDPTKQAPQPVVGYFPQQEFQQPIFMMYTQPGPQPGLQPVVVTNPPGQNQNRQQPVVQVETGKSAPVVTAQKKGDNSSCAIVTNVFAILLGCLLLGIPGLIYGISSSQEKTDMKKKKSDASTSCWLGATGVIFGVLIHVAWIIAIIVINSKAKTCYDSYGYKYSC